MSSTVSRSVSTVITRTSFFITITTTTPSRASTHITPRSGSCACMARCTLVGKKIHASEHFKFLQYTLLSPRSDSKGPRCRVSSHLAITFVRAPKALLCLDEEKLRRSREGNSRLLVPISIPEPLYHRWNRALCWNNVIALYAAAIVPESRSGICIDSETTWRRFSNPARHSNDPRLGPRFLDLGRLSSRALQKGGEKQACYAVEMAKSTTSPLAFARQHLPLLTEVHCGRHLSLGKTDAEESLHENLCRSI